MRSTLLLAAWASVATATPPATPVAASPDQANEVFVKRLSKTIEGHEKEPAAQVFKNIQLDNLKQVPAAQLLGIMRFGYSRALGVTCTHCHVESDFSKDDLRPKRAAREMAVMHHGINQQLAKMENLDSPTVEARYVNCATCHRGSVKPTPF